MYDVSRILPVLSTRVGWKQPTQSGYAILDTDNLRSDSGRYFQNVHAAVTIENIKETQPDKSISQGDFNTFLEDIKKAAILKTLSAVITCPEIVETVMAFDREPNIADEIQLREPPLLFCGYRIRIGANPDFATALTSVALYFNAASTITLKCYVDNQAQPIWEKNIEVLENKNTIVPIDDLILSYMGAFGSARDFYIGYFQDDQGSTQAYNERVRTWNYGCMWWLQSVTSICPGARNPTPVVGSAYTHGLNLQLTTYQDFTNRIIANKALFDEAISLQVACDVLELILSSNRSNDIQRMTQEQLGDLYRSLNQEMPTKEAPYGPGLKARYQREIEKIHKALLGQPRIESHSLPYAVYEGRQEWD